MEEPLSITPINFFQLSLDCLYLQPKGRFPRLTAHNFKQYLLPDVTELCDEESFADVAMAWNEEGLEFFFKIKKRFEICYYPDIIRGDSVEVFIDTRDVKTSGYNTRFCHHFFFLKEEVNGYHCGEITHFRTEDAHELCKSDDLFVQSLSKQREYSLNCKIPKASLFGFDPLQFDRLGFTYRINFPKWQSQHFSVVTEDYPLEEQPSLWSHIKMVR